MSQRDKVARAEYANERRKRLLAEGICAQCQKRPIVIGPRGGKTRCLECQIEHKRDSVTRTKARRADLRTAGRCVYCGKPVRRAGPRGSRRWCEACQRKGYITHSDRMSRLEAIRIYGGACADCGITDVRVLEFHHSNHDGAEERRRDRASGYRENSGSRIMRKIAKSGERRSDIEMICANCHKIRHWLDREIVQEEKEEVPATLYYKALPLL